MMVTILFIGINASLEAWPMWTMICAAVGRQPLSTRQTVLVAASFAAMVLLNLCVFVVATRNGIRALEKLDR
jgi:hypothetical protein